MRRNQTPRGKGGERGARIESRRNDTKDGDKMQQIFRGDAIPDILLAVLTMRLAQSRRGRHRAIRTVFHLRAL